MDCLGPTQAPVWPTAHCVSLRSLKERKKDSNRTEKNNLQFYCSLVSAPTLTLGQESKRGEPTLTGYAPPPGALATIIIIKVTIYSPLVSKTVIMAPKNRG